MATPKVLSPEQIEQFIEEGYTRLEAGFPREWAAPVLDQVWALVGDGVKRDDPSTWKQNVVSPTGGPKGPDVARLYTERVRAAFGDLVGEGRWVERGDRTGAWPIILPGFATKPWKDMNGWHVDGGGQRRLRGKQQALIAIMLFSDISPGEGGTALRPGSHKIMSRCLAEAEPTGLTTGEFNHQVTVQTSQIPPIEAQGQVGDLVLCHAYMAHSSSTNTGDRPRVITNNCIALHEEMNLDRADPAEFSALERSIVQAIATARK
ncbi:MAG: phytanoyl-CoA dioxygenase family protein [Planctomycetota bacterium]|nr:phytanoyl-CoA dioxygenase family protein [Planctomycetota bacterium]